MPRPVASAGPDSRTGSSSTITVPSSGRSSPYRIRISVVLPAPFSPTMACTVPGAIESVTASLATTPPKRRVTSRAPSRISGGTGSGLVVLRIALIDHVPDLDRAVDDPLLGLVHVGHDVVRHVLLRVLHLRQSDAVLLQAERAVLAALELAAGVV